VDGSLIKADASRHQGIHGGRGLPPEAASRAVEEYLAVLDDAAFGAATDVPPKFISPATGAHGGQASFGSSRPCRSLRTYASSSFTCQDAGT
jgi:hypothetical protein